MTKHNYIKNHHCKVCGKTITDAATSCYKHMHIGENNYLWKGNKVGYTALHDWIKTHHGIANKCENPDCTGISKLYEWANISHEYKRDRNDFKMLCRSCHRLFDKRRTHCKNGHEFTLENSRYMRNGTSRVCKTCEHDYYLKRREKLENLK